MDDDEDFKKSKRDRQAIVAKVTKAAEEQAKSLYREETGRKCFKKMSDETAENALEMIARGEMMLKITEKLRLTRGALASRAAASPNFARRLHEARATGAWSIAEYGSLAAMGEEGFTTGSIERDKLVSNNCWKWARHLNQKVFGDKVQVDQRTVQVNISKEDADDW